MSRRRRLLLPALLLSAGLFLGSLFFGGLLAVGQNLYQNVRLLGNIVTLVSERYVDDVNPGDLYLRAIRGMLETLDPHTQFLTAGEYEDLQISTTGNYGGLGIEIGIRDEYPTVIAPIEGGPAYELGIQAGDKIIAVEGESTRGWSSDHVVKTLRGPKGSGVTVTIQRAGVAELFDVTITRDTIELSSVPYALMITPRIGLIRLRLFSEGSREEVEEAIQRLEGEGMEALILDLRANHGGLLTAAIEMSDLFLKEGATIVSTRGRTADQNREFKARDATNYSRYPLVVVTDENTASAAEILAGALQDHDRALLIGEPTFGKGLVQTLFELEGGAALKLTTARYYTPSGRNIQRPWNEEGMPIRDGVVSKETVEYRTEMGRIVYGGGGIAPDLLVTLATAGPLESRLGYVHPLLFKYAVQYRSHHPELKPGFEVSDRVIQEFQRFLLAEAPEIVRGLWVDETPTPPVLDQLLSQKVDGEREYLRTAIGFQVARAAWGDAEAYRHALGRDRQVQKAISLLAEANRMASEGSAVRRALFRLAQVEAEDTREQVGVP